VADAPVEAAAAGDQAQLRLDGGAVHAFGGKVLVVLFLGHDDEAGGGAVRAGDVDGGARADLY
jgi:hypothetical protein